MMFVLVADGFDGLTLRRLRPWHRLAAWFRAASLDEALAGGAVPEGNAYLAARALQLTSVRSRRDLAAGLRRVLASGPELADGLAQSARVPIRRARVAQAAPELSVIVDCLLASAPVPAQGVAMVRRLLSDGSGPLYSEWSRDDVCDLAQRAAEALAPAPAAAP